MSGTHHYYHHTESGRSYDQDPKHGELNLHTRISIHFLEKWFYILIEQIERKMDEQDEAIYTAMMYGKARRFDQILRLKPIPQLASLREARRCYGAVR